MAMYVYVICETPILIDRVLIEQRRFDRIVNGQNYRQQVYTEHMRADNTQQDKRFRCPVHNV
mgnify:CR=1 FL=1|jgi:hypothetical protein